MKVELRALSDIRPYENNPRVNDTAVAVVAASIREFGFRQPIVVDTEGVIVVGHTRWKAAQKLGLATVPIHVATELSPEQAKAYRIADNQTATLSDWDSDRLTVELLALQELDFDLDLVGFSADDLARLMNPNGQAGLCDPDEIPEPPDAATTQPGDLPHPIRFTASTVYGNAVLSDANANCVDVDSVDESQRDDRKLTG